MQGDPTSLPAHVSTYTMYINAAGAEKILKVHTWSRQRPIDRQHVEYLRNVMGRGELRDLEITYGQLPSGEKYLVDGYHRLTAMSVMPYPLPTLVKTYQVKDENDLARLYMTLDRPKVRSVGTMIRASGLEEQTGLTQSVLTALGSAAFQVEMRFESQWKAEKSLVRRVEITEAWLKEGEHFNRCLAGCTNEVRKMLVKQPVMAVALVTLRHQPEQAHEFWRTTALEDKLERTDPRSKLLAWLRLNKRISAMGPNLYARHVANCWNAFVEGRSLQFVRSQEGAIKILGTPFKGKDR